MSTSQNCIHIQKVSSMFRIDLDVCREFIESGLIEVTVQFDEEYIATQELGKVQRIVSLYRDQTETTARDEGNKSDLRQNEGSQEKGSLP